MARFWLICFRGPMCRSHSVGRVVAHRRLGKAAPFLTPSRKLCVWAVVCSTVSGVCHWDFDPWRAAKIFSGYPMERTSGGPAKAWTGTSYMDLHGLFPPKESKRSKEFKRIEQNMIIYDCIWFIYIHILCFSMFFLSSVSTPCGDVWIHLGHFTIQRSCGKAVPCRGTMNDWSQSWTWNEMSPSIVPEQGDSISGGSWCSKRRRNCSYPSAPQTDSCALPMLGLGWGLL